MKISKGIECFVQTVLTEDGRPMGNKRRVMITDINEDKTVSVLYLDGDIEEKFHSSTMSGTMSVYRKFTES